MMKTNEGAFTHEHSLDHLVEFFSKAGSVYMPKGDVRDSFYKNEENPLRLFQMAWIVDKVNSFKLLLWLRDCRGGAGNRSAARVISKWIAENDPKWITSNIEWFPKVGRWDDLRTFFGTQAEFTTVSFWADALRDNNVLAAKWADRSDYQLRQYMDMKIGDFRRFLANIRKQKIVEYLMCSKNWNEINYGHVPSVAMSRYTNAFKKHDEEGFTKYKESLKKGEAKIHADVLFPHDCVRTVRFGDSEIADAQFDALPNFMTEAMAIVISDTSGSMEQRISDSGNVEAIDVSQGMALYCSAKMPKDSPFYKRFIAFESESEFKDWRGMTFSQAVTDRTIFDRAVGSTRVHTALDLILKIAKNRDIGQKLMPTMLLIVSDMQFHAYDGYGFDGCSSSDTEIEHCLMKWDEAGYERPQIIYWNTAGYQGSQDIADHKDVGLISGFSPSILKSVFEAEDFTPRGIMMKTLEKYEIVIPD